MPTIIINSMNKEQPNYEIIVSQKEAEQVMRAWQSGAEMIIIGNQSINPKYIISIKDGDEPITNYPKLQAPTSKPTRVRELLNNMRKHFEEKGLFNNKKG
jgi:hypothetical protein